MRYLLCFFFLPLLLSAQTPEIRLAPRLVIRQSCRIKPENYRLAAPDSVMVGGSYTPLVTITGDNLTVDFQNAELHSLADPTRPDLFKGLAIEVVGQNITIKNARVHGFKVALLAHGSAGLRIENCDFSYNYRPHLLSTREKENEDDWLSYHHNERNEWLRYGAGLYLDNCLRATVRNCHITGCQNALLMANCNEGLVYNNTFNFNSGLGIGLYRSSLNRLMHNFLDWNVRGYSHGFYQRGQDSAGILVYEQSSGNLVAYNSATHSGDGFFLWAGQHTMDTGEGGCNDNWIFGNDFSYAPTNGVEVTFSRNQVQGNFITECTYGIWGGYSWQSRFNGNLITNCRTGIAIEHGQQDTILQNYFGDDSVGVQLWARAEQPTDWGYAQKRDTRSRDTRIDRNVFAKVRKPLKVSASENIAVNGENLFSGFEKILDAANPNPGFKFFRNDLYSSTERLGATWAAPELAPHKGLNFSHPDQQPTDLYAPLMTQAISLHEPDSLPDGMLAMLPAEHPRGRQWIIVGEWGPYDFQRPIAVLDKVEGDMYAFKMLGPPGEWKVVRSEGTVVVNASERTFPGHFTVQRDPAAPALVLEFEAICYTPVTGLFGEKIPAEQPYRFEFRAP